MRPFVGVASGVSALLLLSSCVSLPTPDARADDLLTSMLSITVKIYAAIETGEPGSCSHDANLQDWRALVAQSKLLALRFSVLSSSDNELTAAKALQTTISMAEATDKAARDRPDKCQNPTAAAEDENAIESAITGLQRLELQKGKK